MGVGRTISLVLNAKGIEMLLDVDRSTLSLSFVSALSLAMKASSSLSKRAVLFFKTPCARNSVQPRRSSPNSPNANRIDGTQDQRESLDATRFPIAEEPAKVMGVNPVSPFVPEWMVVAPSGPGSAGMAAMEPCGTGALTEMESGIGVGVPKWRERVVVAMAPRRADRMTMTLAAGPLKMANKTKADAPRRLE